MNCYRYNGSSMNPTFHDGHLLYIRPDIQDLVVGDVIVYRDLVRKVNIVHRIVSISDHHLITRGDNNPYDDPDPVQLEQVLGKVETMEDNLAVKTVQGGQMGLWGTKLVKILRSLFQRGSLIYGYPYRLLRQSGLMGRFWRPVIVKVHVQINEGSFLIKYIHNHRTVAVWDPLQRQFNCSKPYDLVLFPPDEKAL
jgi:signal peptidase I